MIDKNNNILTQQFEDCSTDEDTSTNLVRESVCTANPLVENKGNLRYFDKLVFKATSATWRMPVPFIDLSLGSSDESSSLKSSEESRWDSSISWDAFNPWSTKIFLRVDCGVAPVSWIQLENQKSKKANSSIIKHSKLDSSTDILMQMRLN